MATAQSNSLPRVVQPVFVPILRFVTPPKAHSSFVRTKLICVSQLLSATTAYFATLRDIGNIVDSTHFSSACETLPALKDQNPPVKCFSSRTRRGQSPTRLPQHTQPIASRMFLNAQDQSARVVCRPVSVSSVCLAVVHMHCFPDRTAKSHQSDTSSHSLLERELSSF